MKRLLPLIIAATLALPCAALADDAELAQVRQKVAEMFDVIEPGDVNASPIDGWYTIQKNAVLAYISADGRYLMQGDLIDLDANVNLSDVARDGARRELVASLSDDEVITFAPEDPSYSVTVFTDIECTYCRRLHNEIEQFMAQGIEVRYLLYPRNGPSSRAWTTSEQVWCSADRRAALTNAKRDRDFESRECDASIVAKHYAIGRQVGLSGTPAIVLDDGELIAGYLPPDALANRLRQKSGAAD